MSIPIIVGNWYPPSPAQVAWDHAHPWKLFIMIAFQIIFGAIALGFAWWCESKKDTKQ